MAQTIIDGNLFVNGAVSASSMTLPASTVRNTSVEAAAGIEASKLDHTHKFPHYQTTGTAVVAAVQDIHILRSTGTLVSVEAAITGAIATDASRTVSVDLQKSTGAAAFATMLSAPIQFTNASVLRTLSTATLAATSLVDGDILRVVVTVAGGAGSQAQGLVATVTINEDYA